MWADRLGWGLAFIPTVIILLTILYTYLTYKGGRNKTFVQVKKLPGNCLKIF